jgi:6-methylsalicylate decarboxylase
VKGLPPAALEFVYDTSRTIASLMMGLVFTDNPDIRFIFSHGGGALPTLADRLSGLIMGARKDIAPKLRGGAMGELKRLNFDTASVTNRGAWAGLTKLVPTSQIFYGTDYPFGSFEVVSKQLGGLVKRGDMERIGWNNAQALFPRFSGSA